jgi:hypothetical protein
MIIGWQDEIIKSLFLENNEAVVGDMYKYINI